MKLFQIVFVVVMCFGVERCGAQGLEALLRRELEEVKEFRPPSLRERVTDRTWKLYVAAIAHYETEEYDKAAEGLRKTVESDPHFGDAWFELGYCLHSLGKRDEALEAYRRSLQEPNASIALANYNVACILSVNGETEEAVKLLKQTVDDGFEDTEMVAIDPELFSLHTLTRFAVILAGIDNDASLIRNFLQAENKFVANDFIGAGSIYLEVTKAKPDSDFAWYRLGMCLQSARMLDEAIRCHEKAASFRAIKGPALYNWACALSLQGEKDKAIERLKEALGNGVKISEELKANPDLKNIRGEAAFKELFAAPPKSDKLDETNEIMRARYSIGLLFAYVGDKPAVANVTPHGAGEQAGLLPGDVILSINGKDPSPDPNKALRLYRDTGQEISFEVNRKGMTLRLIVRPKPRKAA